MQKIVNINEPMCEIARKNSALLRALVLGNSKSEVKFYVPNHKFAMELTEHLGYLAKLEGCTVAVRYKKFEVHSEPNGTFLNNGFIVHARYVLH